MPETEQTHTKIDTSSKITRGSGGFGIQILYPGKAIGRSDFGIGAIGRIDHAKVQPGALIKMHPHKDDEILTYLRKGSVLHKDSEGLTEQISAQRLMLMGAGHTFEHEELVLNEGVLEGLQIFIRPTAADLPPQVQFHDFGRVDSADDWRLVAGPGENDPLQFRSSTWVFDMKLAAGTKNALPPEPVAGTARLLYVFSGSVHTEDGIALRDGECLLVGSDHVTISANEDADLVLFVTDESAQIFTGGMFSGDIS